MMIMELPIIIFLVDALCFHPHTKHDSCSLTQNLALAHTFLLSFSRNKIYSELINESRQLRAQNDTPRPPPF